jgi:DnaJ-class molecular chaperone
MKRRVEKIEMECPECEGVGHKPCELGTPGAWFSWEAGEWFRHCEKCQGSGKVLDFPPEDEYERDDERFDDEISIHIND